MYYFTVYYYNGSSVVTLLDNEEQVSRYVQKYIPNEYCIGYQVMKERSPQPLKPAVQRAVVPHEDSDG